MQELFNLCATFFFCLDRGPKLRAAEHKSGCLYFRQIKRTFESLGTSTDARDFLYSFMVGSLRNDIRSVGRVNIKTALLCVFLVISGQISGHFTVNAQNQHIMSPCTTIKLWLSFYPKFRSARFSNCYDLGLL